MRVHTYVIVLISSLGFYSCVLPESGGGEQIGVSGHSSFGGSIGASLGGATVISFGSNAGKTDIGGSTAAGMAGAGTGGGFDANAGGSSTGGVASCDGGFVSGGNDCVSIRVAGSDVSIALLDDNYQLPEYLWNNFNGKVIGFPIPFNAGDQVTALGAVTWAISGDPSVGTYDIAIYTSSYSDAGLAMPDQVFLASTVALSAATQREEVISPAKEITSSGTYWLMMHVRSSGTVHLETTNRMDVIEVVQDPILESAWPSGSTWANTLVRITAPYYNKYNSIRPHLYARYIPAPGT